MSESHIKVDKDGVATVADASGKIIEVTTLEVLIDRVEWPGAHIAYETDTGDRRLVIVDRFDLTASLPQLDGDIQSGLTR